MITIEQLKSIKERTEALYRYLDIEGKKIQVEAVSYTHLRAHETGRNLVCRLLLEKKN